MLFTRKVKTMNYRISICAGLCIALAGLWPAISLAQSQPSPAYSTPAKHLLILDFDSGEILFEKNAHAPTAPASMTKIMTASVVFDRIKSGALSLDDEFIVSEDAWRRGGVKSGSSTMFLKPKSKVTVRDLLHGVIVQSGNDACIVLAEGIAGSEPAFALLMNEKAKTLGLESAHFTNATGWPDEQHLISTLDLAILARSTIMQHPELYKIYAKKSFTWNGIKQPNRNPLFAAGFAGADGLKTGHTKISKYGFVGSALQSGKRRIFVVNGLESKTQRRSESIRIMRSAFNEFAVYNLFKASATVGHANVFMGKVDTVSLVTNADVQLGMHKSMRPELRAKIKYHNPVPAPITQGAHIADLIVSVKDEEQKIIPLYAGETIKRKSVFGRVTSALVRKIRGQ